MSFAPDGNSLFLCPTRSGSLLYDDINKISYYLTYGGLCLLPSDSGYFLAATPAFPASIHALRRFSESSTTAFTAFFGSRHLLKDHISLDSETEHLLDFFCPGPLTILRSSVSSLPLLSELCPQEAADIGLAIPDSPLTRQLSVELGTPLYGHPVNDANGRQVSTIDEARQIVAAHLSQLQQSTFCICVEPPSTYSPLRSSIVRVHGGTFPQSRRFQRHPPRSTQGRRGWRPKQSSQPRIDVIAEGDIPKDRLESSIVDRSFADIEDFT